MRIESSGFGVGGKVHYFELRAKVRTWCMDVQVLGFMVCRLNGIDV